MTDYDSATYYECGESETLTHESPEEALEAFVESWQEPGLDTMRLILFYSFGRVWSCSKVGERTYSGEELEEMMREYNPDWFKATTP